MRNDEIGAHLHEAATLPGIDAAAFRLGCRHADGNAICLFHFFDFDIAITENEQFVTTESRFRDELLDE